MHVHACTCMHTSYRCDGVPAHWCAGRGPDAVHQPIHNPLHCSHCLSMHHDTLHTQRAWQIERGTANSQHIHTQGGFLGCSPTITLPVSLSDILWFTIHLTEYVEVLYAGLQLPHSGIPGSTPDIQAKSKELELHIFMQAT